MILVLCLAFSLSLWTSVWQARARDVRFGVRYVLAFWLIFTPVIYPIVGGAPESPLADAPQSADGTDRDVQVGDVAGPASIPGRGSATPRPSPSSIFATGVWHFARTEGATHGHDVKERWEASPRPPGAIATTAEVWQYRRLLSFIGDRALRKTYRRTILGWLWLFINPLFPIALRALIFGGLLGVGSNGTPVLPLSARWHGGLGRVCGKPDVGNAGARNAFST